MSMEEAGDSFAEEVVAPAARRRDRRDEAVSRFAILATTTSLLFSFALLAAFRTDSTAALIGVLVTISATFVTLTVTIPNRFTAQGLGMRIEATRSQERSPLFRLSIDDRRLLLDVVRKELDQLERHLAETRDLVETRALIVRHANLQRLKDVLGEALPVEAHPVVDAS